MALTSFFGVWTNYLTLIRHFKTKISNNKQKLTFTPFNFLEFDLTLFVLCEANKFYKSDRRYKKKKLEFKTISNFQSLNQLLDSNAITLIDVRNRTELNTVGQIPGSVCLPLHEVSAAMELSSEEFSKKYDFQKPSPDDRKIVLTCRSGKRVLVRNDLTMKRPFEGELKRLCFDIHGSYSSVLGWFIVHKE